MQMHVYPRLELIGDRDPVTKEHTDGYTVIRSVMKTRIDRLIETVSRCILDESKVRLCSVCNARPRAT